MSLSDDEIETLLDLGFLDDDLKLAEALTIQGPPEEPEPPSMDSPPGEWTEYSDTPKGYRLLRLSREVFTAEEAAVLSETLCKQWGVRKYGEGHFCVRWWCWRVVPNVV
jgi:hypothetical protein